MIVTIWEVIHERWSLWRPSHKWSCSATRYRLILLLHFTFHESYLLLKSLWKEGEDEEEREGAEVELSWRKVERNYFSSTENHFNRLKEDNRRTIQLFSLYLWTHIIGRLELSQVISRSSERISSSGLRNTVFTSIKQCWEFRCFILFKVKRTKCGHSNMLSCVNSF